MVRIEEFMLFGKKLRQFYSAVRVDMASGFAVCWAGWVWTVCEENALKIFEIHLKKELLNLTEGINISLNIAQEVKEHLAEQGYDATYGARLLKGIIRTKLRRPLAKKLVAGEFKEGDTIEVLWENNEVAWKKSNITE